MTESAVVSSGDDVLASQYNNLRKDVLDTSLGHTHNGTDSKILANSAVVANMLGDAASFENAQTKTRMIPPSIVQRTVSKANDDANAGWSTALADGDSFPIIIPNGAIITRLDIWAYSTNQAGIQDVTVDIKRNDLDANTEDAMAQVVLSWGDAEAASFKTGNDTSISNATIDDSAYNYYGEFTVNLSGGYPRFKGALITYTQTVPA